MARTFDDYVFDHDDIDLLQDEQAVITDSDSRWAIRHQRIRKAIELREDRKRLRHELEYFAMD